MTVHKRLRINNKNNKNAFDTHFFKRPKTGDAPTI